MKVATLLTFLMLATAGCASNQSADGSTADAEPAKQRVCTNERSTGGFSRVRRVCRDAGD